MRTLFTALMLIFIVGLTASKSQSSDQRPIFQLNHVDLCIDTITFNAMLKNSFLRDSFGFIKVFTDSTGSEILLLGKESFIHLLPDKGFFENRLGASLLVHHSYRNQETKSLMEYLQSFTKDSLYNRPYVSAQLNIDYINVYENLEQKDSLLKFIPILQNHSAEDYLGWGYTPQDLKNGITQKRYMADYVGTETANKLFKNIETITIAITNKEKMKIPALLRAYGYKYKKNGYKLPGGPMVYLENIKDNSRTVQLVFTLSKQLAKQEISISDNAVLTLMNNTATLTYTTHEYSR